MPSMGVIVGAAMVGSIPLVIVWNMYGGYGYISPSMSFSTIEEFRESNGGDCVKKYFNLGRGELNVESRGDQVFTEHNPFLESSYRKREGHGCLVVNWDKSRYEDNRWDGRFRWVWSFVSGDWGVVTFNLAKFGKTQTLQGMAYLLGRDSGGKWKVKYAKTSNGSALGSLAKAIPEMTTLMKDMKYPTFLSLYSPAENSICGVGGCQGEAKEKRYFNGSWNWRGSSNISGIVSPLKGWSSNFDEWWNLMYSSANWNLPEHINSFVGVWRNVDYGSNLKTIEEKQL